MTPPPFLDASGFALDDDVASNEHHATMPHDDAADALSEVLKTVRIEGALFRQCDLAAPWRLDAWPEARAELLRVSPTVDHVVSIHYVVDGRFTITHPRKKTPVLVNPGDLVLCASGGETLSSVAGEVGTTRFVSGALAGRRVLWRRFVDAMPPVLVVPGLQARTAAFVNVLLHAGLHESRATRPGGGSALAKMGELLFLETIRLHAERTPAHRCHWLAAVRDVHVGRALALMHTRPECRWTVQGLAKCVALSRSTLAEKFRRMLGESPIQYLTRWRLGLAAEWLAQGTFSMSRIAERAGYESETAFNRAFKREFGVPPGQWRARACRAAEAAAA